MRLLMFLVFSFAALLHAQYAYDASKFRCKDEDNYLILELDPQTLDLNIFSYYNGANILLARSVTKTRLNFKIGLFRPESAASGSELTSKDKGLVMEFSLPASRPVTRVQSGGYYHPIYNYYPFTFTLTLTIKDLEKTHTKSLSCTGT